MSTLEALKLELARYAYQTMVDAIAIGRMVATGDLLVMADVTELETTAAAFRHRNEVAVAALAQVEALETSVLDGLMGRWTVHGDAAFQEIAHDYTRDGTLAY